MVNIARIFGIGLLIALIVVGFMPLFHDQDIQYYNQAANQSVRSQIYIRNTLILKYYQPNNEQAISDFQLILPLFEASEAVLLADHVQQIHVLMQQIDGDYLALDNAIKAIIAKPIKIVIDQKAPIIIKNSKSYISIMNDIISLLEQRSHDQTKQTFLIEIGLEALLFFLVIFMMFFSPIVIREAGIDAARIAEMDK